MLGRKVHLATPPLSGEPEVFHFSDAGQAPTAPGPLSAAPAGALVTAGVTDPDVFQPDAAVAGAAAPADPDVFHPAPAANPDVFHDSAEAADLACLAVRSAIDRLSVVLAGTAAAFVRLRAWTVFGFARLEDHARERYGRSGRWVRDLATLGEGIAASPELAAALSGSDGGRPLGRVAATMVARALPLGAAAADWIAAARRLSVRELRDAIRQARAADADADHCAAHDADDDADDDPDADRCLLRLPVPEPMLAAFEEALDLHRAVQGRGTSVTEFIEALVGEAQAGGLDVGEGLIASLRPGLPEARVEAALRFASGAWSSLPAPAASVDPLPVPVDPLSRFVALDARAGEGDAVELDARLRALVHLENQLETQLGLLLSGMTERHAWARLQFAGVGHYAEERLGLSRSRASDRARLARALRALPLVSAACADGRITLESASLILRILRPDASGVAALDARRGAGIDGSTAAEGAGLEAAWVEHAAAATIKRMRDEARALGRYRVLSRLAPGGERPEADRSGSYGPGADWPMSDEDWCASLRRAVGTATRRIQWCGFLAAGITLPADTRITPPVNPDVFHADVATGHNPDVFHRMLPEPDACLRLRLPADLAGAFLAAIEAARAAFEVRAAAVPWDEPWPPPEPALPPALEPGLSEKRREPASAWAARMAFVRGRRVPRWVGLLALLEDYATTWDSDGAAPDRRDDRFFVRDGWRCAAPGCSSRRNLELHHIVYRSRGGSDDGWNLITLCCFHHRCGEHGFCMSVRGRAPTGLTWRLGRDDVAVEYRADLRRAARHA